MSLTQSVRSWLATMQSASTARDAGYKQTVNILRNEDDYAGMLIVAKAELRSFKNKYAILSELKPIFELIDEL